MVEHYTHIGEAAIHHMSWDQKTFPFDAILKTAVSFILSGRDEFGSGGEFSAAN